MTMRSDRRPVVGIPVCIKQLENHRFHAAGAYYVEALVKVGRCTPILLPALGIGAEDAGQLDSAQILSMVDGIMLTGSISNVAPQRYGKTLASEDLANTMDFERDATTLPLITAALAKGVPIFGICRGIQEINVAMGGTLYQEVHRVEGFFDHRNPGGEDLAAEYRRRHTVHLAAGGYLRQLIGKNELTVNSLHGQGIELLGQGLIVEATAPDGLIEAVRVKSARFALAVQWHPEWQVTEYADSTALFAAFGQACAEYAKTK